MADTKPSEKDILADNARLIEQCNAATSRLVALETSIFNLRGERDTVVATLTQANEKLAAQDVQIASLTKANADLKATAKDIETQVAAKVAELGISAKAVTQPKPGAAVVPTSPAAAPAAAAAQPGAANVISYTELCQAHLADRGGAKYPITTDKPANPK
jgi:hypothetical protein